MVSDLIRFSLASQLRRNQCIEDLSVVEADAIMWKSNGDGSQLSCCFAKTLQVCVQCRAAVPDAPGASLKFPYVLKPRTQFPVSPACNAGAGCLRSALSFRVLRLCIRHCSQYAAFKEHGLQEVCRVASALTFIAGAGALQILSFCSIF